MNPDFQKFLNDCNSKYKNDYFPFLSKEQEEAQSDLERKSINDDGYTLLGKLIGFNVGFVMKSSNYISIKHLETYHNWLLENYDIKPKN